MVFKKIEQQFIIWNSKEHKVEIGDSITGEVVKISQGKFGRNVEIKVLDASNTEFVDQIVTLPAHKTLQSALDNTARPVRVKDLVKVVLTGEAKSDAGKYPTYDVFVDEE